MGDVLGRYMHRLEAEYSWQLCNWHEYRSLYGTGEQRIALLNKAGSAFFSRLQSIIWESVLLGIARLTDPRKDVITLNRLPNLIRVTNRVNVEKLTNIKRVLAEVNRKCAFATDWRNRHIAHRNSSRVLEGGPPLHDASRQHVEDAHREIANLLNEVQLAFGGLETIWNDVLEPGNTKVMLHVLSEGIRSREQTRSRFRNGTYTQEDIANRRIGLWTPAESIDN